MDNHQGTSELSLAEDEARPLVHALHHQLEGCGLHIGHGEFNPAWGEWPRALIAEFKIVFKMKDARAVRWFLGRIYLFIASVVWYKTQAAFVSCLQTGDGSSVDYMD